MSLQVGYLLVRMPLARAVVLVPVVVVSDLNFQQVVIADLCGLLNAISSINKIIYPAPHNGLQDY